MITEQDIYASFERQFTNLLPQYAANPQAFARTQDGGYANPLTSAAFMMFAAGLTTGLPPLPKSFQR